MDKTIVAAMIGAGATIATAVIGVYAGKAIEQNSVQNQIEEVLGNNVNVVGDENNVMLYDISTFIEKHIELQTDYNQLKSDHDQLQSQNSYLLGENTKLSSELEESNQKIEVLEEQLKESENGNGGNPTIPTTTLSPEGLLIQQNFDLIRQLKECYSDADTKIIENDCVEIEVYEKAAYVYQNLMKTEDYDVLRGEVVPMCKIAIVDYDSDEIIYWLSSENSGDVKYWPGNNSKFYCVVFHDDYDIYVSPPIRVIGGDSYDYVDIVLDRKNSEEYTPLFELCLHLKKLESEEKYSTISNDYWCNIEFRNVLSNCVGGSYSIPISDLGIALCSGCTYFSLNTNYVMDISISPSNNFSYKSTYQTFDGSVTNSNLIHIYLEFEDEE